MNTSQPITAETKAAAGWLSQNAYIDEAGGSMKENLCTALKQMKASSNGPYDLIWGPSAGSDYMVYIAQSSVDGSYAIAFRGTSGSDNIWAFISNWIADVNSFFLVPWQYPWGNKVTPTSNFSSGMYNAFLNVIGATDPDTSKSMLDFMREQLDKQPATIMVTGHSLGGALANLTAVYLSNQLPQSGQISPGDIQIVPFTFAAPTVTDVNFKNLYDGFCPKAYHAVNTIDIVPMTWRNVQDVLTSFPAPGQQLQDYLYFWEWDAIKFAVGLVPASSYAILSTGLDAFAGPTPASGTSFATEAGSQHSMLCVYLPHVVKNLGKDGEWLDWLDHRLK